MNENVKQLEEEVRKNLIQENEINRLYKQDLNLEDYVVSTPEPVLIDVQEDVKQVKQTLEEMKKKYFGEGAKYVTEQVEGKVTKKAKTLLTNWFGGKREVFVPEKPGEFAKNLERIEQGYEQVEQIKTMLPKFDQAKREYDGYLNGLRKTYTMSMIQVKQMFDEESNLEDLLGRIDKELESDSLEEQEYRTLMENRDKIEQKKEAIQDYIDVVGFQAEGTKNMLDLTANDSKIFAYMVRSLGNNMNKLRIKLSHSKFIIYQGQNRMQLNEVYQKLNNVNNDMQGIFDNTTTMLEESNQLFKDSSKRFDSRMFTQDKINRFDRMRKEIYSQGEMEKEARRKRLFAELYKKDDKGKQQVE